MGDESGEPAIGERQNEPLCSDFFRVRSRETQFLALACVGLQLSGCIKVSGFLNSTGAHSISGFALPFTDNGTLSLARAQNKTQAQSQAHDRALTCSGASASLYALSSNGQVGSLALQTVPLAADGSYSFQDTDSLGIKFSTDGQVQGSYIVQASGCNSTYRTLIAGAQDQDISFGSSLVMFLLATDQPRVVTLANSLAVQALTDTLGSFADYASAYGALSTNPTLSANFRGVFGGVSPEVLKDAAPSRLSLSVPATATEHSTLALAIAVTQWSPTYAFSYLWELDGAVIGTTANLNYVVSGNTQGLHTLSVFYGQKNTSNVFDQTKPFGSQSFTLQIANNIPAVAPLLSVVGPATVYTASVPLQIATGAGLVNCDSFSKLALTEDSVNAPANDAAYSVTCSSDTLQTLSYTLTSGYGLKTLRLWAKDSSGNISALPSVATVTYLQVLPAIAFTSPLTTPSVQGTVAVAGTCDTASGQVTFAGDVSASSTSCGFGTFSQTLTLAGIDGTKTITASQTNTYGNTGSSSITVIKDTTSPVVTIVSPASGGNWQTGVTLAGACETGLSVNFSGAGALGAVSGACTSSTYSQFVYFSAGDGAKSITVTQTDLASNSTTVTGNFVRDTTPPAITQTLVASPYSNNINSAIFGGACESGLSVVVSGADNGSTTCSAGAWSYTTNAKSTDGSYVYTFTQTDSAGNVGAISATWVRKTSNPLFTFTSASSSTTSANSISFAGNCVTGLAITVGSSGSGTLSCNGGQWSYTSPTVSVDGDYTYTFAETDQAGNVANITGLWTRSTSGPTLTVTQVSPQISNASSIVISGTCSGGNAGSNGVITITGASTGTVACSSTTSTVGSWTYTANQTSDNTYTYNFSATDNFVTPRSTQAVSVWERDTTSPVSSSLTINGGSSTTGVSYNPIAFSATDNISFVTDFCIKTSSTPPLASDACWTAVNGSATNVTPSNSVTVANYSFNLGILAQTYTVYIWLMDGAGNISTNNGVAGVDTASITLAPVPAPSVMTVLASNSDVMAGAISERTIPGGSDVYIRWTAAGNSLGANPITLYFTADDTTYTTIAASLANGINNCDLLNDGAASAGATGCYKWSSGSPSSAYYRVRVSVTNTAGGSTLANSLPINAANMQLLAGNTEAGLTGAASAAIFQSNYAYPATDNPSLAVAADGTVYFRDVANGIVYVSPQDGKLRQLIGIGAATSGYGDGGPVSAAKLRYPSSMVMDFQQRLLVFDYDRIRRIDLTQRPPTIATLIGGGSSTADSVASPLQLSLSPDPQNYSSPANELRVLPNGNIYFFSELYRLDAAKRIRVYNAASNSVTSLRPNGPTSGTIPQGAYGITNAANCYLDFYDMKYDPITSAISTMNLRGYFASNCGTIPGGSTAPFAYSIDPATGLASNTPAPQPPVNSFTVASVDAHDGNIYGISQHGGYIFSFDPVGNVWHTLAGTGTVGNCADGTIATQCNMDPATAYVDANKQLYFVDRGRVRTIINGQIATIYGQGFSFGDGGLASNARFGSATAVQERSDGSLVMLDFITGRFRSFLRTGTIATIAGNDVTSNYPATNAPANTQPIQPSSAIFTLDGADNIYYSMYNFFYVLPVGANPTWIQTPAGSTNAASTAANGQPISTLYAPANDYALMATNGTSNLYGVFDISAFGTFKNSLIAEYDINSGINSIDVGPVINYSGQPLTICPDGTTQSACQVYSFFNSVVAQPTASQAQWDSVMNKWLVLDQDGISIRTFSTTTTVMTTATVLANPASAIAFATNGGARYLYYCNSSTKTIYVRNMDLATEMPLAWPIPSVACFGNTLFYDSARSSLIFPFTQNGLPGVAELLNVGQ